MQASPSTRRWFVSICFYMASMHLSLYRKKILHSHTHQRRLELRDPTLPIPTTWVVERPCLNATLTRQNSIPTRTQTRTRILNTYNWGLGYSVITRTISSIPTMIVTPTSVSTQRFNGSNAEFFE
ncbi:hypothetical protein K435DRAFT_396612 [Dendrothele bispora CBS 962.96]|uniref:Uncharacterized protein n=1 Tax=Dendrothele bispora (strain CBS 962.96) TaxID=1314807 RepID=A0A4S8MH26_DENBC|nr:hypothetical protein K435DRAFT_396612 [Dendrothele bispora CBS 962.96]